jgi:phage FluMu protein Com
MVKITKEQKGNILAVKLVGDIEEMVDFEGMIGPVTGELHVYCRDIPRINSTGVKAWILYFQKLTTRKVTFKFFECSPAIVQQINLILNFTCGGAVESLYVPYACPKCKFLSIGLFQTAELRKIWHNLPEPKCPKCQQAQAQFDDIPEEYFGFLDRS